MGRRRGDIFSKRDYNYGSRLVTNMLTGFISMPFAVSKAASRCSYDGPSEPISTTTAIVLIIIGVLLTPLFVPLIIWGLECFEFPFLGPFLFFAFIFIPLVVWGVIITLAVESFKNYEPKTDPVKVKKEKKPSRYEVLASSLVSEFADTEEDLIRQKYYDLVEANRVNGERKLLLNTEIEDLEKKYKIYSQFGKLGDKYARSLEDKRLELAEIETQFQELIIAISESPEVEFIPTTVKGQIYIDINHDIVDLQRINFDSLPSCKSKDKAFFAVDSLPQISFPFSSIELNFYKGKVLVMVKKDFAVVNRRDVNVNYRVCRVELHPYNSDQGFKVVGKRWKHSCLDGTPDLRYKNNEMYTIVEVGVLEIGIASEKINLIFSNQASGWRVYKQIS